MNLSYTSTLLVIALCVLVYIRYEASKSQEMKVAKTATLSIVTLLIFIVGLAFL